MKMGLGECRDWLFWTIERDIYIRIIFAVLSIPNILLLVTSWRRQNKHWNLTRFFIVTMAIIDLVFTLGMLVMEGLHVYLGSSSKLRGGKYIIFVYCYPLPVLLVLLYSGVMKLRAIKADPSAPNIRKCTLLLWIILLFLVFPIVFITMQYVSFSKFDDAHPIVFHLTFFILPAGLQIGVIIAVLTTYTALYRRTRTIATSLAIYNVDRTVDLQRAIDIKQDLDRRSTAAFAIVSIASTVISTPNVMLGVMVVAWLINGSTFIHSCLFFSFMWIVAIFGTAVNYVMNGFIYLYVLKEFREDVQSILYCGWRNSDGEEEINDTVVLDC